MCVGQHLTSGRIKAAPRYRQATREENFLGQLTSLPLETSQDSLGFLCGEQLVVLSVSLDHSRRPHDTGNHWNVLMSNGGTSKSRTENRKVNFKSRNSLRFFHNKLSSSAFNPGLHAACEEFYRGVEFLRSRRRRKVPEMNGEKGSSATGMHSHTTVLLKWLKR